MLPEETRIIASPRMAAALGYLNFSSGASDPTFLRNLNDLFCDALAASTDQDNHEQQSQDSADTYDLGATDRPPALEPWQLLGRLLQRGIDALGGSDSTLGDVAQASRIVDLIFDAVLPAYLEFHEDLLFHQSSADLLNSLFIGRVAQAVLSQGPTWDDNDRVVDGSLDELNDYLGYRPVAVLETEQKIEPYQHERIRPVPLYIAGAGVAEGPYRVLIEKMFDVLRQTDPDILHQAWFDLQLLDELAFDPRAYDFDHPAQKRPNHPFGQWDMHRIDNRGFYRRFVVQQVTLEAAHRRTLDEDGQINPERLLEAASVLAGTILMGSGTSGNSPETHDSSVSLAVLLPHIASYRDAFYLDQIGRITGPHGDRLRAEAARLKQPFGGARQDLNAQLARLRATQLQHVHLAHVFARMGYSDAANHQASIVPAASARMMCDMHCRLSGAHLVIDSAGSAGTAVDLQTLGRAAEELVAVEDLLHRAIDCGAVVDPWNILGFDAQFSLFNSLENSVHDHRVDQLIDLVDRMFGLSIRLVGEASAGGYTSQRGMLLGRIDKFTEWWDQFASETVSSVDGISGLEAFDSAEQIGRVLAAWHQGGAARGDIAFWREFVDEFDSPKTFAHVAEALLEKQDHLAAMSLLIQWAGASEEVALEDGEDSFHALTSRWLAGLLRSDRDDRMDLAIKFLDYLEANAEEFWEIPELDLLGTEIASSDAAPQGDAEEMMSGEEEETQDGLFSAAYEGVVYRDSTADGVEGDVFEPGDHPTDYELELESKRLGERLAFVSTVASAWKTIAQHISTNTPDDGTLDEGPYDEPLRAWHQRARGNARQLDELLRSVRRHRIAIASNTYESMVEYDRRRMIKEMLLERIIGTCVDVRDAACFLSAAVRSPPAEEDRSAGVLEQQLSGVFRSVLRGQAEEVESLFPDLIETLSAKTILYVPLARGGDPRKIATARTMQQAMHQLLAWLPRLGLLSETFELIDTVREMEVSHPVGVGAVTEFDRMFETGYKAAVDCLIASSESWTDESWTAESWAAAGKDDEHNFHLEGRLIDCLKQMTEPMLIKWLSHCETLRLSVLERIEDEQHWQEIVTFIQRYGHDLFTQYFLNIGNLRAILHQGVDDWLDRMEDDPEAGESLSLIEELDGRLPREDAAKYLTVVLEAVVDNYVEYRDYNSTTTASDHGEQLHSLLAFLRLKSQYERTNWNLRPLVMAHEMLVRRGRSDAAGVWRRAMARQTAEIADQLSRQLARLRKKFGMKLTTVADRIGERFIRPLLTDRAVALVRPAMAQLREAAPATAFGQLLKETDELTQEPTGVGLDVPDWLMALEDEVEAAYAMHRHGFGNSDDEAPVRQLQLSLDQVQRQLGRLTGD